MNLTNIVRKGKPVDFPVADHRRHIHIPLDLRTIEESAADYEATRQQAEEIITGREARP